MKITIYELLGLIKDGKAPKKIKYRNKIYFRGWSDYMGDEPIDEYYYDSEENSWNDELCLKLDDEVKILDQEDEFIDIEELNLDTDELLKKVVITAQDYVIEGKINDLIKNQKKIIDKLKIVNKEVKNENK